jgi:3-oxoacyl-[acyl-carrier protein] reductase
MEGHNTALVTGGSKGIGAAIVRHLLAASYSVIIADVIAPEGFDLHDKIHFIKTDLRLKNDRAQLIAQLKQRFSHLKILVNNAGVSVKERKDMLECSEESYDQVLETNLKGPFFLTQQVARWMIDSKRQNADLAPVIINIASLTSYASATYLAEYALSKSGVSMMTRLFADRLSAEGIKVHEIRPGIIETDMTKKSKEKYDDFIKNKGLPIARWGLPDDVARAVIALSSDYFPYSTGEVINVDGGFHIRRL